MADGMLQYSRSRLSAAAKAHGHERAAAVDEALQLLEHGSQLLLQRRDAAGSAAEKQGWTAAAGRLRMERARVFLQWQSDVRRALDELQQSRETFATAAAAAVDGQMPSSEAAAAAASEASYVALSGLVAAAEAETVLHLMLHQDVEARDTIRGVVDPIQNMALPQSEAEGHPLLHLLPYRVLCLQGASELLAWEGGGTLRPFESAHMVLHDWATRQQQQQQKHQQQQKGSENGVGSTGYDWLLPAVEGLRVQQAQDMLTEVGRAMLFHAYYLHLARRPSSPLAAAAAGNAAADDAAAGGDAAGLYWSLLHLASMEPGSTSSSSKSDSPLLPSDVGGGGSESSSSSSSISNVIHPRKVGIAARCGLGQLALQSGDFVAAEKHFTSALEAAEEHLQERRDMFSHATSASSSSTHHTEAEWVASLPLAAVLSLLGHLYERRGRATHSSEGLLAEGLFRKSLDLLEEDDDGGDGSGDDDGGDDGEERAGAQGQAVQRANEDTGSDLRAITMERYATLLDMFDRRASEATRLRKHASAIWRRHHHHPHQLASLPPASHNRHATKLCIVDALTGRVIFPASSATSDNSGGR